MHMHTYIPISTCVCMHMYYMCMYVYVRMCTCNPTSVYMHLCTYTAGRRGSGNLGGCGAGRSKGYI